VLLKKTGDYLRFSQEPVTGLYPKPDESSPQYQTLFKIHFKIILHLATFFRVAPSLQVFWMIFFMHFLFLQRVLRAPRIPTSFIWTS